MKFEISELNINKIVPYENNPRDNAKTVQRVIDSIQNFGWQVPIVVDEEFIILAGHTRLKAAKLMNLDTVPVKIAKGLTESQKTAFRIMDNKAQEFSSWDTSQLAIEFDKLVGGDFDLKLTGFDFEEIQKINNALLKFDSSELDENFNEFQISEDFDIPETNIKQFMLLYDINTLIEFKDMLDKLKDKYDQDNYSDIVFTAVKNESERNS
jgi:ParB-like chromosome segregation protein Spo0J